MNDLAFQVELFADLMVRVDDPFGTREAAVTFVGLDEDGYRNLVGAWRVRFERDATGALATRFADAYAVRRAALLDARRREQRGEEPAKDPRFLNTAAHSFREDAAKIGREGVAELQPLARGTPTPMPAAPPPGMMLAPAPTAIAAPPPPRFAGTADISAAVPRVSLPFAPAPSAERARAAEPPPAPPRPHPSTGTADISAAVPRQQIPFGVDRHLVEPEGASGVTRAPEHLTGTADISAFVPRAATPFAAPAARRRLIRFDPQTGQPLPAPIWVDLPPEPPEPGAPKK